MKLAANNKHGVTGKADQAEHIKIREGKEKWKGKWGSWTRGSVRGKERELVTRGKTEKRGEEPQAKGEGRNKMKRGIL